MPFLKFSFFEGTPRSDKVRGHLIKLLNTWCKFRVKFLTNQAEVHFKVICLYAIELDLTDQK